MRAASFRRPPRLGDVPRERPTSRCDRIDVPTPKAVDGDVAASHETSLRGLHHRAPVGYVLRIVSGLVIVLRFSEALNAGTVRSSLTATSCSTRSSRLSSFLSALFS